MSIPITGGNIIAGKMSRDGDQTFTGVDPRTGVSGEVEYVNATQTEIDDAVQAAVEAYRETRTYPPATLADFLDLVADEIDALGDQLLETTDRETALGIPRLTGERVRTTGQLRAFGELLRDGSYVEAIIDTAQPDRQPTPRPTIRRMLFPIGPVVVFGASNFPYAFSVPGGDTASAFAAGCPVIAKGHPSHPATSELFAFAISQAVEKSGFPSGFFSLIQGHKVDVGQELVKHPDVEAVAFTGSLKAGRAIYDTAAARARPIPVYAEMGSINPVVILPGAIAERHDNLADALVGSVTLGSGQFCTNPGLILVIDQLESQSFIDTVVEKMAENQPGVLLNANVERSLTQVVGNTRERPSVTTLTGGMVIEGNSFCYANTVLQTTSSEFRDDAWLQTEHFGPVTLFVTCGSIDDIGSTIGTLHGNLAGAIHASEDETSIAGQLYDRMREKVGRMIWNGFPTGVEVVTSMQHGGPYPATTAPGTTSVGMTAIRRFLRPVAYQGMPDELMPEALKDDNPLGIWRIVDNELTRDAIS